MTLVFVTNPNVNLKRKNLEKYVNLASEQRKKQYRKGEGGTLYYWSNQNRPKDIKKKKGWEFKGELKLFTLQQ